MRHPNTHEPLWETYEDGEIRCSRCGWRCNLIEDLKEQAAQYAQKTYIPPFTDSSMTP